VRIPRLTPEATTLIMCSRQILRSLSCRRNNHVLQFMDTISKTRGVGRFYVACLHQKREASL
jgi:hypothetical protein